MHGVLKRVIYSESVNKMLQYGIEKSNFSDGAFLALYKAYILCNKLPKSLLKELLSIENTIVASKAKSCNTQTKLLSFFCH